MFFNRFFFQIRTRLRTVIRTRSRDLATRRDQPRHTRACVQDDRGGRTATGGRARAVPGARHQDGRVPGRETRAVPGREARAVPGRQAVRRAHREEGPGARRQAVPRARLQDQAHLPRAQVGQMAQRLVNHRIYIYAHAMKYYISCNTHYYTHS